MPHGTHRSDLYAAILKKAWSKWFMLFIPLGIAVALAQNRFGYIAVLPWMFGLLIVTLLYQRHVKKRTWRSILLGVQASDT